MHVWFGAPRARVSFEWGPGGLGLKKMEVQVLQTPARPLSFPRGPRWSRAAAMPFCAVRVAESEG